MTTIEEAPAQHAPSEAFDVAQVGAFAEKVAGDRAVAANAMLVYLGDRLGLWQALASIPAVTSAELADHTRLAERYVREWLAAQTAAGYLHYEPLSGRFTSRPSTSPPSSPTTTARRL